MSKLRGVSKRITALLLSGMLIIGSTSGSVLAASIDLDPSQTSEIAEEVYDEDTSEALAGEEEMAERSPRYLWHGDRTLQRDGRDV